MFISCSWREQWNSRIRWQQQSIYFVSVIRAIRLNMNIISYLGPDGVRSLLWTCVQVVMEEVPRVLNFEVLVSIQAGLETLQTSEHNEQMPEQTQ